jgi:pimeloyl-ACP methyl ester carboxylesterase
MACEEPVGDRLCAAASAVAASAANAYQAWIDDVAELIFGRRTDDSPWVSDRGIHWEDIGDGGPVLLIMGLGLSGGAWWRTVPVLAKSLRVITFDHRGVGRSHSPTYSFTTEAMAEDAVSVLDAAGIERAHIYGISLGGMVAQQLALRHPDRVRSLVLGATHSGGPRVAAPEDRVIEFFRRRPALPQDEAAWASVPYNYGPDCRRHHAERIAEDIEQRLTHPFPGGAYRAQLHAAQLHNARHRLREIEVPTLIVHGRHDRVIPVANAHLLADAIPHARLRILEHCGHMYPTEQPDVDREIAAFLADVEEAP